MDKGCVPVLQTLVVASKLEPGYLAVLLPSGDTVLLCVAVPVVCQQQAVRALPCAADPATGRPVRAPLCALGSLLG